MVLRAREDKGLLAEQPLDGFGKPANDHAPRPWIDSRSDPAVGDRQKLFVFGEPEKSGALQPEKLAETSEPRSERLVHLGAGKVHERAGEAGEQLLEAEALAQDRKSTRLNSSHRCISYAVFCLKKKKIK